MSDERRHELQIGPSLTRMGVRRPDLQPLPLTGDVQLVYTLGAALTAARSLGGRYHGIRIDVPALALNFSVIAIGVAQGGFGYWLRRLVAIHADDGSPLLMATGNRLAVPGGIVAAGTAVLSLQPDDKEEFGSFILPTIVQGNTAVAPPAGMLNSLNADYGRNDAIWWNGCRWWFTTSAVNRPATVELFVEDVLPGIEQQTQT